jgi:hypothetical protein
MTNLLSRSILMAQKVTARKTFLTTPVRTIMKELRNPRRITPAETAKQFREEDEIRENMRKALREKELAKESKTSRNVKRIAFITCILLVSHYAFREYLRKRGVFDGQTDDPLENLKAMVSPAAFEIMLNDKELIEQVGKDKTQVAPVTAATARIYRANPEVIWAYVLELERQDKEEGAQTQQTVAVVEEVAPAATAAGAAKPASIWNCWGWF